MSWKTDLYIQEISMLKTEKLKKLCEYLIDNVMPERTFTIRPSSSGRYHPEATKKMGGLCIHNKRSISILNYLVEAYRYPKVAGSRECKRVLTDDEIDCMRIAVICHDMCKRANYRNDHSLSENHPLEAVELLEEKESEILDIISRAELKLITQLIRRHMGPWGASKDSIDNRDLSKFSIPELIFYFSDYLSSRDLIGTAVDKCILNFPEGMEESKE